MAADRRAILLAAARDLYAAQGPSALAVAQLNASGVTEAKLRGAGLNHTKLLAELGLTEEYQAWRGAAFTYAGQQKPRWTWERAIEVARDLIAREGDLPTVQWCRLNGHSQLVNCVHRGGREWEDLRVATGLPPTTMPGARQTIRPRFFDSRSGIRWRSRPEACLSNFLYARGVEHRRGERYPAEYEAASGRAHGRYDLHFTSAAGAQIDVEIWGDIPDALSHGRYAATRAMKEAFHQGRPDFLPLHYLDCLSETRLTALLEPHLGVIEPFRFDKPTDRLVETAHWSDYEELLETCRQIAALAPGGVFPSDDWLRKRGRHAGRPGETYNTVAERVNSWFHGARKVRELLGQSEASTTQWTRHSVVETWRRFEAAHGLSPSQTKGAARNKAIPRAVALEGGRIYEAARRLGALADIRAGQAGRKRKWTPEHVAAEWKAFCAEVGLAPTACMSRAQRARLPREITDRATRLYQAAGRLGLLDTLRGGGA